MQTLISSTSLYIVINTKIKKVVELPFPFWNLFLKDLLIRKISEMVMKNALSEKNFDNSMFSNETQWVLETA